MDALSRVEAERLPDTLSTFESLVKNVLPTFRVAGLSKPWEGNFDIQALTERYGESDAWASLESWLEDKHLAAEWMKEFAVFSMAIHNNRPSAKYWGTPPIKIPPMEFPAHLSVKLEGWHPEFETRDMAAARLQASLLAALATHLKEVEHILDTRPAPRITTRHERRDLEWLALNRVHGWSPTKIAHEFQLGTRSHSGHTGRPNIARALARWRSVIEL